MSDGKLPPPLRLEVRNALQARHPALFDKPAAPVAGIDRTAIVAGRNDSGSVVSMSVRARLEHSLVIGTTGGGKTKLIEHLARQDVIDGRGICLVDPHGNHPQSLYRSMLSWLDRRGYTKSRTLHLIDPNAPTHATGINPLALPSDDYEPTVIAEAMQEALERMWGEEDFNSKPTMQRVLSAVLTALTELKLTLAEARLFFDAEDRHGIRAWAIENLQNQEARDELVWLHEIAAEPRGRQDFRLEVTGPRNRLAKLTRDDAIRAMIGQELRTIDFRAALDDGHIILANLSPGPRAGDKATQLLGRLLTRSLFFHAQRRVHPERPFFFYCDECQLYLSGDVSRMLGEARKYGVGAILSSQALANFRIAGDDVLDAVKNMTNTKVVLRIKNPEEASELADMVFRYDLEMPVKTLTKPTVVGHRISRLTGESASTQYADTNMSSHTVGESVTESSSHSYAESESIGESVGTSETESLGSAHGTSEAELSGSATGASAITQMVPSRDFFAPNALAGFAQGTSSQQHAARSNGSQSSSSSTSASGTSRSSSYAQTASESWSDGIAMSRSTSRSTGRAETRGQGTTNGWRETFEPILEDRPAAVHSLESVRYMAATALRHLVTGRAAISFVDAAGMKTATLRIANVESFALRGAAFEELRRRVLEASPSATPIGDAEENICKRQRDLIAEAAPAAEPETPAEFRTKRRRPQRSEPSVDVHGERSAPERPPVKGHDRRRRRP